MKLYESISNSAKEYDIKQISDEKLENKGLSTDNLIESEEPKEDKELPLKERVLRAYDNCNYSVDNPMPTISDIIEYLGLSSDTKTRNEVIDILYKDGKDWQIEECDKNLNETVELKESYDMYNVVEDAIKSIERLKGLIDDGTFTELSTISKELELMVKNIKDNVSDAW